MYLTGALLLGWNLFRTAFGPLAPAATIDGAVAAK
jgi:hypothetical protein